MARHHKRIISSTTVVRQLLADRINKVTDPSLGSPTVDYNNNPWVSYADLTDVFAPLPLDANGNPIREVVQKEWREDPRSLKGWTEMPKPVESSEPDLDFKL